MSIKVDISFIDHNNTARINKTVAVKAPINGILNQYFFARIKKEELKAISKIEININTLLSWENDIAIMMLIIPKYIAPRLWLALNLIQVFHMFKSFEITRFVLFLSAINTEIIIGKPYPVFI